MRLDYALRKLIFRRNQAIPSATKLFLWQFSWIIPYLLLTNYLERNLFPLRLLCYTQYELLTVPRGDNVDFGSCLRRFFPSLESKTTDRRSCLFEEPIRVLIDPEISQYHQKISVIRSAPASHDYRDYIRETWKPDLEPDIPVIFVLGTGEYNPRREAELHQDIMQFDFVDSYSNLTLKMTSIYKYFFGRLPNLAEIIVINDDAIANATALKRIKRLQGATLHGKVSRGYPRLFFSSLLWYIPYEMYPKLCYPPFVQGSSFIVTRDAAQRIVHGICSFPRFDLDDVFMGILASCLGINMEHSDGFDQHNPSNFVIFHYQWSRFSAAQLKVLYKKLKYASFQ